MQVIHLEYPNHNLESKPAVAAIGYFDGIHLGHQGVIRKAIERAAERGVLSALITFDPHPREILKKDEITSYITPLPDKMELLQQLGVDLVYVIRFTWEFSQITPEQFISDVLLQLGIIEVVVGFDFRFGKGGAGTPATLREASNGLLQIHVVDPIVNEDMKISSSLIRDTLKLGNMEQISGYLSRPYMLRGKVMHGDKRGREIGFPTANLALSDRYFLPKNGVYGVRVKVLGNKYFGVMNLGLRPTFVQNVTQPSVEIYIMNFDQEIYGQELIVEVLFYIRDEQKFAGITQLIEQINKDIVFANKKFMCYTV